MFKWSLGFHIMFFPKVLNDTDLFLKTMFLSQKRYPYIKIYFAETPKMLYFLRVKTMYSTLIVRGTKII